MLQIARLMIIAALAWGAASPLGAADDDRDFSGRWILDRNASNWRALSIEPYEVFDVRQAENLHCTANDAQGAPVEWTYFLSGAESKYRVGAESMNSVVKWEGAALLVNTLVTGPRDYAVMDRWTLSRDRRQLVIERQISRSGIAAEGRLVYGHQPSISAGPRPELPAAAAAAMPAHAEQPSLVTRPVVPAATAPKGATIPAGTHILLSLSNSISTKNSNEGDRVYLQTAVPVAQDGRVVIPRGSYVQATVTKTKPAGRMSHKGELYLLFNSLTLPNGVTRDFRARLTSADAAKGKVDPNEGKVSGDADKDPHKVATGVGLGSMGGVIVGGAAGHPVTGLGVGAAAGLAAVLLSKNQDVVLPRGTSVEMVLDRDLYYTAEELRH